MDIVIHRTQLKIIYLKNLFVKGEIEFHFSRSARNRRTQKKPTPATVRPLNKIEEADEFDYDAASMEEEMRDQKSEDAAMMMDSENL